MNAGDGVGECGGGVGVWGWGGSVGHCWENGNINELEWFSINYLRAFKKKHKPPPTKKQLFYHNRKL